MSQHIVKLDRNNKSIVIRALHSVYRQRKQKGQCCANEGQLILRIYEAAIGKLCLTDTEYHTMRTALSRLRDERLAAGSRTDAVDEALYKLLKARQPFNLFCL